MQQGKQQPQHQPAVDPAFWNITRNSKLGEFESGMSQMLFNQALDYHKQNQALKNRIKRLEDALYKIEFYAATGILQDSFDEIKRIAKEAKL